MDACPKCKLPYSGDYTVCDPCAEIEWDRDTELIRIHETATADPNDAAPLPDPDDEDIEECAT
ncbi:MAG: hypothetical protein ABIH03_00360 [Pseudomonadota bacterium]